MRSFSAAGMTERSVMNKPSAAFAKPLRDLVGKVVGEVFARQGFASAELVTRWPEIVGAEIAAHSEPIKIQWPRGAAPQTHSPGVLVLRVEGPSAVEIQHLGAVICERVNGFFGWRAVERLAFRQSPLRRGANRHNRHPDPSAALQLAATMPEIADEELRQALARLKAEVKRP
jgi:hypothetical protein